jgi:hypothetical protein
MNYTLKLAYLITFSCATKCPPPCYPFEVPRNMKGECPNMSDPIDRPTSAGTTGVMTQIGRAHV